MTHGARCLQICAEHEIADFDLALAYEALARAHAVAGDAAKSRAYIALAEKAAEAIEDEGNRDYTLGEIASVKEMF